MRAFMDWEFLEDGSTIAPISVGLVREDGTEYYAVFDDVETLNRAVQHDWLRENVVPSLPLTVATRMPSLTATAALRMKEARTRKGWSAQRLGEEMAKAGLSWDRSQVANLEVGRRKVFTVEEWFALAVVLDVSPMWLVDMEHVDPWQPLAVLPMAYPWEIDESHADRAALKPRDQIRHEVKDFLLATPDLELWGWYSSYDHVCLAQLFGRMIDLPDGVPMWTNDLRQEVRRLRLPEDELPKQEGGVHNALADARHLLVLAEYLDWAEYGPPDLDSGSRPDALARREARDD